MDNIDTPRRGRGRIIRVCLLVIIFLKELYYISGLAANEEFFEGLETGSRDTGTLTTYITVAFLCIFITISTDIFFETWCTMVVNISSYILTAIALISILLIATIMSQTIASQVFNYFVPTYIFAYIFTPITVKVFLDFSKNLRFACLMMQIVHHSPIIVLLILELSSLMQPLYLLIVIFLSLILTMLVFYLIIKAKEKFSGRKERIKDIASTFICLPLLPKALDLHLKLSTEVRKKGNRFWIITLILSYKIFEECVKFILKDVWDWQTSLMLRSELRIMTKPGIIYDLMSIPIFVLVYCFYYKIHVSELKKVAASLFFLVVPILYTIFIEMQVRPAIRNYQSSGEAHLRVINGLLTPFSFTSDAQGYKRFFVRPGQECNVQYVVISGITEDILTVSIVHNPGPNQHSKDISKPIFVREGKSSTYVMYEMGLIRVTGYDPVFEGPPGTNRHGFSRIQIISSHIGNVWIDKHHLELPGPGSPLVISIKPGNISGNLTLVNGAAYEFSIHVYSDGAYSLIFVYDNDTKTFMHMRFPMLEPIDARYEQILIPITLMLIAHANTELATFYFIYSETPPSLRCTMFGIYYFYKNIGRAIAKYFFTPGLAPLYLTVNFAILNAIFTLRLMLFWKNENESE